MHVSADLSRHIRYTLLLPAVVASLAALVLALSPQHATARASGSAQAQQSSASQAATRSAPASATAAATSTPAGCTPDVNFSYASSTGAVLVPGTTDTGNHCELC